MGKTFIYICRPGENEELRYSIRSVALFYPKAKIWVVGGKPDWYCGNYIEVPQTSNSFKNVRNNLAAIIDVDEIPNDIIIMNDDFFFLKHLKNIPFYISGTLKDKIYLYQENEAGSSYVTRLIELRKHCKRFEQEPMDFELHVPIQVNKKLLSRVVHENVMWRSNYGNRFIDKSQTKTIEDVKVYPKIQYSFKNYDYLSLKYPFVSTQDDTFEDVRKNLLEKMFPTPSQYEII